MLEVGDKVAIRRLKDLRCEYTYSEMLDAAFISAMDKYCGEIGTIRVIENAPDCQISVEFKDGALFWYDESYFE